MSGRVCAGVQVLLGILGALVGTAAMSYLGLFYGGVLDVISIDVSSTKWHRPGLLYSQPLINNSLLLLIFCVSHSLLARQWVKTLFYSLLKMSPTFYRHFCFFQSSACLFLICYGWTPQSTPVWDVQYTLFRFTLYGISVLGVVITTIAFFSLPALDFFGIQEPLQELMGGRMERSDVLVTSGVYGYVRHPMYTGLIMSVWSHPTMTISRLLIAVVLVVYLLVAVPWFEEPDLVKQFGSEYRQYMRTTPMMFPINLPSASCDNEKNKTK